MARGGSAGRLAQTTRDTARQRHNRTQPGKAGNPKSETNPNEGKWRKPENADGEISSRPANNFEDSSTEGNDCGIRKAQFSGRTRDFSSIGKKDFVSASMYCYAAFLMWLWSDDWRGRGPSVSIVRSDTCMPRSGCWQRPRPCSPRDVLFVRLRLT